MHVFSSAQPKMDADRPDQTESAVLTPAGYVQAEFGFDKENEKENNYNLFYPTALLKYGLSKRFELRFEADLTEIYQQMIPNPKITTGIEPVGIGFRTALWEEKKILPKTSLLMNFAIPGLASKPFKADHIAPTIRLAMQNSLTENIGISYNIGAQWDGFSTTPGWLYTLSNGFDVGKKWYVYIEEFGVVQKNEPAQNSMDTGVSYLLNKNTKLDISCGIGFSENVPKNYFAIGGSFRFKAKK